LIAVPIPYNLKFLNHREIEFYPEYRTLCSFVIRTSYYISILIQNLEII
jgi:hypothetical protein